MNVCLVLIFDTRYVWLVAEGPPTSPKRRVCAVLPGPVLLGESVFDIEVSAVELQGRKPPIIQRDGLFHI